MHKKIMRAVKAFTLVELIVVIAIIAILSAVGFVSYNGYIRDSRNSKRAENLGQLTNLVTQFNAKEGRLPQCNTGTVCQFVSCSAADAPVAPAVSCVKNADYAKMNIQSTPADPRQKSDGSPLYYVYAYDTSAGNFVVAATQEAENVNDQKGIVRGTLVSGASATLLSTASLTATTIGQTPTQPNGSGQGQSCAANTPANMVTDKGACIPYSF